MPFRLGAPELIIILVIVIVLFGTSRISTIGRDLGAAIREFRKGMGGDEAKKKEEETPTKEQ
ncbi:MAG: twin-arginine translocase TatA/TatE family subunit [Chloroflexi bacterium]|nr:twin-arginine translocase TatA/TatE family subunit [Chloroflexota bacterium]